MKLNILAIISTALFSLAFGFIWFSVLFGKLWKRHMGQEHIQKPSAMVMLKSFSIFIFGALLTSLILACLIEASRFISMFHIIPPGTEPILLATVIWVGFYLPNSLGRVSWEFKSWWTVFISASYELLRLVSMALIFWYWR